VKDVINIGRWEGGNMTIPMSNVNLGHLEVVAIFWRAGLE